MSPGEPAPDDDPAAPDDPAPGEGPAMPDDPAPDDPARLRSSDRTVRSQARNFGEAPAAAAGSDPLVRASVVATAVLAVTAGLAAAVPDVFVFVSVPAALGLFLLGCGAFLWAYVIAVGRSRHEAVSLGGLTFLSGDVAPAPIRRALQAALAAQVAVALVTAAVRPFTPLAFGVLAPTAGVGLMALWAARHGRFPPRPADHPRSRG